MQLTQKRIKEIALREKEASPGPWTWEGRKDNGDGYVYHPQGSYLAGTLICLSDTYEDDYKDLDFIANARQDIPDLLAHIEYTQSQLDFYKSEYEKVDRCLRQKDKAMGVLFNRLTVAGVDCSDLIP